MPSNESPKLPRLRARVSVSNTESQAVPDGTNVDTTGGVPPEVIFEQVKAHIRMAEIETAVATLQRYGWRWENFDPGRSGLVPGWGYRDV